MTGGSHDRARTQTLSVNCSPERAFEVFTAEVATWWPTKTHSIHYEDVTDVVLEPRVGRRALRAGRRRQALALGPRHGLGAPEAPRHLLARQSRDSRANRVRGDLHARGRGHSRRARAPQLGGRRRRCCGDA